MDKVYKINGHNVEFYCNEENRIVTATIKHCTHDATSDVRKNFGLDIDDWTTAARIVEKIWLPDKMKCVAHCHSDDEYNIEKGKMIAYKKLRKKYWKKYSQRMFNMGNIFVAASTFAIDDAQKALDRSESITW